MRTLRGISSLADHVRGFRKADRWLAGALAVLVGEDEPSRRARQIGPNPRARAVTTRAASRAAPDALLTPRA